MKKFIIKTYIIAGLFGATACTDLTENAYDQLLTDNFYNNRNEVISAVLRPYTHANAWITPSGQDGWWRPAELSADQLAWPTKGRHGEDGGKWKRLHYHTWTVDEGGLANAWRLMYWGMGLCNDPIANIADRASADMGITDEEKASFIAELKLLRAFHYLKIMDLFGNIPVVTVVGEPQQPETVDREEVFHFIESEILENIELVPELSSAMLGRMSKAGGYAMLVELYLNAEVWTGTPRWDDCIAAADHLINGQGGAQNGVMELDPNIEDQFGTTNHLSKEVIFSIAYDYSRANFQPSWTGEFYHFQQREIYGGGRNGNNGVVVIPGVYQKYADGDLRKSSWLLAGDQLNFATGEPVLGSEEYNGRPLVFVDEIRRISAGGTSSTMSDGEENSGIRFNKYKLGNQLEGVDGTPIDENYNNTDWNVYRLTWVYFAKAEALMRKNNGKATQEAVELINLCKKRAFTEADWQAYAYTTSSLTLEELLEERGREFIFEGFRRNDLIRFDKFHNTTWWDHNTSDAYRTLFPIPQQQRDMNPNLQQNPGYPG
ncbi:RagB/SusD family nutrient uptake outer membrane protein [Sphingobacterium gobiense]|uniref:RagB/SusD family nutrient uptake outer membrane protein n=1 Tax=Sphingobacterium gobiense TaxID=1382456 RepID=A0A2S9JMJ5_9SPHI|nr:RagB/SusD family nutrient uptake outer membrane protein [Sphingobacterium gobiense]PRD54352.1 RagB/SusD family nutrient uptake outer membrane protein [Sphingobacterium gobiense]